ncbi:MAG: elongation factor P [Chlamydiae bacterium]|nr:elongation factor P [Chlamydiota bacterium]
MVATSQLSPGMILTVDKKLFRVESCVKVTAPKGPPFMKVKLRNLATEKVVERNFKMDQEVEEVTLDERRLEYLYLEGKDYCFLDVGNLDQVAVAPDVVGDKANYLKEGVELEATFYGERVFSVELPQFLELMVAKSEGGGQSKQAVLETGASVEVPPFIEAGDVIKVDTRTNEYIQRV